MGLVDKRRGVEITVTLSSQLIAAALAMLAVEGAFAAYALGERVVRPAFPWIVVTSGFFFVTSVFVAGKGITEARDSGFDGNWDTRVGRNKFNWQAICLISGLSLFAAAAALSGTTKKSLIELQLLEMQSELREVKSRVEDVENEFDIAAKEESTQSESLDAIRDELRDLKEMVLGIVAEMEGESGDPQP